MSTYFLILSKLSFCFSMFYIFYLLTFRKSSHFKLIRFYLLSSVLISVLISFVNLKFSTLPQTHTTSTIDIHQNEIDSVVDNYIAGTLKPSEADIANTITVQTNTNYWALLKIIYWTIVGLFGFRFLLGILKLSFILVRANKLGNSTYVSNQIKSSCSFGYFIIIGNDFKNSPELNNIIAHEKIHVKQLHTIDLLIVEILTSIMWFNPLIWLFRKTITQLHEFLADEGVLRSGINSLEYQTLLINHAAEDRLILSSGLNQSLLKKRIMMMTQKKQNPRSKAKLWAIVPISGFIFGAIVVANGSIFLKPEANLLTVEKSQNKPATTLQVVEPPKEKQSTETDSKPANDSDTEAVEAAVALTRMNVLYIGVDNPMNLAVSGYRNSDITVSVDNGEVVKVKSGYILRPKTVGNAIVAVFANGKKVKEASFRVKPIPDPIAMVGGMKSGKIDKKTLLDLTEVEAVLDNFDFEAEFKITSFDVSAMFKGFAIEKKSRSNKITAEMKALMQEVSVGDKITFTDIKCIGPDGVERSLNGVILKIKDSNETPDHQKQNASE